ncbi:EscU/YscU/HrcU family type III secretion system export apparatus switch protein [Ferrimonas marina]|uniref:Flagellar biosynthetic protein FlhB n=1 Tax=Ferrimonas marina TaxID=299255 RepID=A0A1M5VKY6_9GAMM|nr:EscU/YscU/HrcU family type III secretion system export apparatus switch protein [Ferrimonas marina]SHH75887.1 flagellar biosynthesis protein [Ferrimonas marina]
MSDSPKQATALHYDGQQAPTVTAQGSGVTAEQIEALAREHGVMIHHDPQLAELLGQLELGQQIPPQLYLVIAELIAYAYLLEGRFPEQWHNIHQRIQTKA